QWFIGKPLRVFYDYNVVGIWQQGDTFQYTDANGNLEDIQRGAVPGDAKIEDVDGNGYIDAEDRKIIGSKMPSFLASVGNRMSFGNLYFSFLVNGVFGVWREDNLANIGSWTYGITNYVRGANYWTPENPDADIISPGYLNSLGHGYYRKQHYVQLKNVTLGYRVGSAIANKVRLSAIDVNVSVNNLHTFSNARQVLRSEERRVGKERRARGAGAGRKAKDGGKNRTEVVGRRGGTH